MNTYVQVHDTKQPSRKQKTAATNPQSARVVLLNGGAVEIIFMVRGCCHHEEALRKACIGRKASFFPSNAFMAFARSIEITLLLNYT